MDYFKNSNNVDKYLEMVANYDASFIVNEVLRFLPKGSTLLELGIGSGKDLELLAQSYTVVGSDYSQFFVDKFNEKQTGIKVMLLDAIKMEINLTFDCIYSNKVLHHLTREEFKISLYNQARCLNQNGIIFMTLWRGEYKEELLCEQTYRATYYLVNDIEEIVSDYYKIISIQTYEEFETDDSMMIVLKAKKDCY